jgi:hypothetical protein
VISNSKCSGITLGKERSTGQNEGSKDGRKLDGFFHEVEVVCKALRKGWNKEQIGSHIVRNNEVFACEQTGICGHLGAAFSVVENNYIHDIWTKRQFDGAEIAGIKFHAAIDTYIGKNRIHTTKRGIWLDWQAQGTRVSQNLIYNSAVEDFFSEMNHGPYLVDNNIFGSFCNMTDVSHGGAFVHNLFAGYFRIREEPMPRRYTPYHFQHQTDIAGFASFLYGDNRFYNNIFLCFYPVNKEDKDAAEQPAYTWIFFSGLEAYNKESYYRSFADGNVYYNNALPFSGEKHSLIKSDFKADFTIEDNGKEVFLSFSSQGLKDLPTEQVTTEHLGKVKFPQQRYEQSDGTPVVIDRDYLGRIRAKYPEPGPFEQVQEGSVRIKVW